MPKLIVLFVLVQEVTEIEVENPENQENLKQNVEIKVETNTGVCKQYQSYKSIVASKKYQSTLDPATFMYCKYSHEISRPFTIPKKIEKQRLESNLYLQSPKERKNEIQTEEPITNSPGVHFDSYELPDQTENVEPDEMPLNLSCDFLAELPLEYKNTENGSLVNELTIPMDTEVSGEAENAAITSESNQGIDVRATVLIENIQEIEKLPVANKSLENLTAANNARGDLAADIENIEAESLDDSRTLGQNQNPDEFQAEDLTMRTASNNAIDKIEDSMDKNIENVTSKESNIKINSEFEIDEAAASERVEIVDSGYKVEPELLSNEGPDNNRRILNESTENIARIQEKPELETNFNDVTETDTQNPTEIDDVTGLEGNPSDNINNQDNSIQASEQIETIDVLADISSQRPEISIFEEEINIRSPESNKFQEPPHEIEEDTLEPEREEANESPEPEMIQKPTDGSKNAKDISENTGNVEEMENFSLQNLEEMELSDSKSSSVCEVDIEISKPVDPNITDDVQITPEELSIHTAEEPMLNETLDLSADHEELDSIENFTEAKNLTDSQIETSITKKSDDFSTQVNKSVEKILDTEIENLNAEVIEIITPEDDQTTLPSLENIGKNSGLGEIDNHILIDQSENNEIVAVKSPKQNEDTETDDLVHLNLDPELTQIDSILVSDSNSQSTINASVNVETADTNVESESFENENLGQDLESINGIKISDTIPIVEQSSSTSVETSTKEIATKASESDSNDVKTTLEMDSIPKSVEIADSPIEADTLGTIMRSDGETVPNTETVAAVELSIESNSLIETTTNDSNDLVRSGEISTPISNGTVETVTLIEDNQSNETVETVTPVEQHMEDTIVTTEKSQSEFKTAHLEENSIMHLGTTLCEENVNYEEKESLITTIPEEFQTESQEANQNDGFEASIMEKTSSDCCNQKPAVDPESTHTNDSAEEGFDIEGPVLGKGNSDFEHLTGVLESKEEQTMVAKTLTEKLLEPFDDSVSKPIETDMLDSQTETLVQHFDDSETKPVDLEMVATMAETSIEAFGDPELRPIEILASAMEPTIPEETITETLIDPFDDAAPKPMENEMIETETLIEPFDDLESKPTNPDMDETTTKESIESSSDSEIKPIEILVEASNGVETITENPIESETLIDSLEDLESKPIDPNMAATITEKSAFGDSELKPIEIASAVEPTISVETITENRLDASVPKPIETEMNKSVTEKLIETIDAFGPKTIEPDVVETIIEKTNEVLGVSELDPIESVMPESKNDERLEDVSKMVEPVKPSDNLLSNPTDSEVIGGIKPVETLLEDVECHTKPAKIYLSSKTGHLKSEESKGEGSNIQNLSKLFTSRPEISVEIIETENSVSERIPSPCKTNEEDSKCFQTSTKAFVPKVLKEVENSKKSQIECENIKKHLDLINEKISKLSKNRRNKPFAESSDKQETRKKDEKGYKRRRDEQPEPLTSDGKNGKINKLSESFKKDSKDSGKKQHSSKERSNKDKHHRSRNTKYEDSFRKRSKDSNNGSKERLNSEKSRKSSRSSETINSKTQDVAVSETIKVRKSVDEATKRSFGTQRVKDNDTKPNEIDAKRRKISEKLKEVNPSEKSITNKPEGDVRLKVSTEPPKELKSGLCDTPIEIKKFPKQSPIKQPKIFGKETENCMKKLSLNLKLQSESRKRKLEVNKQEIGTKHESKLTSTEQKVDESEPQASIAESKSQSEPQSLTDNLLNLKIRPKKVSHSLSTSSEPSLTDDLLQLNLKPIIKKRRSGDESKIGGNFFDLDELEINIRLKQEAMKQPSSQYETEIEMANTFELESKIGKDHEDFETKPEKSLVELDVCNSISNLMEPLFKRRSSKLIEDHDNFDIPAKNKLGQPTSQTIDSYYENYFTEHKSSTHKNEKLDRRKVTKEFREVNSSKSVLEEIWMRKDDVEIIKENEKDIQAERDIQIIDFEETLVHTTEIETNRQQSNFQSSLIEAEVISEVVLETKPQEKLEESNKKLKEKIISEKLSDRKVEKTRKKSISKMVDVKPGSFESKPIEVELLVSEVTSKVVTKSEIILQIEKGGRKSIENKISENFSDRKSEKTSKKSDSKMVDTKSSPIQYKPIEVEELLVSEVTSKVNSEIIPQEKLEDGRRKSIENLLDRKSEKSHKKSDSKIVDAKPSPFQFKSIEAKKNLVSEKASKVVTNYEIISQEKVEGGRRKSIETSESLLDRRSEKTRKESDSKMLDLQPSSSSVTDHEMTPEEKLEESIRKSIEEIASEDLLDGESEKTSKISTSNLVIDQKIIPQIKLEEKRKSIEKLEKISGRKSDKNRRSSVKSTSENVMIPKTKSDVTNNEIRSPKKLEDSKNKSKEVTIKKTDEKSSCKPRTEKSDNTKNKGMHFSIKDHTLVLGTSPLLFLLLSC